VLRLALGLALIECAEERVRDRMHKNVAVGAAEPEVDRQREKRPTRSIGSVRSSDTRAPTGRHSAGLSDEAVTRQRELLQRR
jgi:hypothetical protein